MSRSTKNNIVCPRASGCWSTRSRSACPLPRWSSAAGLTALVTILGAATAASPGTTWAASPRYRRRLQTTVAPAAVTWGGGASCAQRGPDEGGAPGDGAAAAGPFERGADLG